jgi:hypothetical protein
MRSREQKSNFIISIGLAKMNDTSELPNKRNRTDKQEYEIKNIKKVSDQI